MNIRLEQPSDYRTRGYFVAEEHPEAFAAYEATFPYKEKNVLEGQLFQG